MGLIVSFEALGAVLRFSGRAPWSGHKHPVQTCRGSSVYMRCVYIYIYITAQDWQLSEKTAGAMSLPSFTSSLQDVYT